MKDEGSKKCEPEGMRMLGRQEGVDERGVDKGFC